MNEQTIHSCSADQRGNGASVGEFDWDLIMIFWIVYFYSKHKNKQTHELNLREKISFFFQLKNLSNKMDCK